MSTDFQVFLVLAAMVAIFGALCWFVSIAFDEIEDRLNRDVTWLEILAFGACFPYSLLILFYLPEKKHVRGSQDEN
jgi:hypothetical protein